METYYLISFSISKKDGSNQIICNKIMKEHPVSWLIEQNKQLKGARWCALINWWEINKNDYDELKKLQK